LSTDPAAAANFLSVGTLQRFLNAAKIAKISKIAKGELDLGFAIVRRHESRASPTSAGYDPALCEVVRVVHYAQARP